MSNRPIVLSQSRLRSLCSILSPDHMPDVGLSSLNQERGQDGFLCMPAQRYIPLAPSKCLPNSMIAPTSLYLRVWQTGHVVFLQGTKEITLSVKQGKPCLWAKGEWSSLLSNTQKLIHLSCLPFGHAVSWRWEKMRWISLLLPGCRHSGLLWS